MTKPTNDWDEMASIDVPYGTYVMVGRMRCDSMTESPASFWFSVTGVEEIGTNQPCNIPAWVTVGIAENVTKVYLQIKYLQGKQINGFLKAIRIK